MKLPSIFTDQVLQGEGIIILVRQPDGNWIGEMKRGEQILSVREVGPETALQKLLTHDGEQTN